jgi:hypothetical protein
VCLALALFFWGCVLIALVTSHSAVSLGKSLFPLFALALDLPEDFFDDKVRDRGCTLTIAEPIDVEI